MFVASLLDVKIFGDRLCGFADQLAHDGEDANEHELICSGLGGFKAAMAGGMRDFGHRDLSIRSGQADDIMDEELVHRLECC